MTATIPIGRLDKRITLQASSRVSDNMGGFTLTWNTQATVWAALMPLTANEQKQADKNTLNISHRIRIRYRSAFKSSWRVKFGNRYFNIVSVINPNEHNEWLDLMCKEAT